MTKSKSVPEFVSHHGLEIVLTAPHLARVGADVPVPAAHEGDLARSAGRLIKGEYTVGQTADWSFGLDVNDHVGQRRVADLADRDMVRDQECV